MQVAYLILVTTFDFPEVLRRPPGEMLALYMQNLSTNVFAYYLFTLTGFSFIGVVILLHHSFLKRGTVFSIATVFGILTGFFQSFGFGRWVFLVPVIAERYPNATDQGKETLLMILEAFHLYAGVFVGENLAFVCQGIWTILVSIIILKMVELPKVLGWLGIVAGVSVGGYSLEQFGGGFAVLGELNVLFQVTWLFWMMALGYYLIKFKEGERRGLSWREYLVFGGLYGGFLMNAYL
ncbi:MAG: DUF4386 domain-containing protein, partial [SAR324 cluster bacterium]|nr:DUF4386 domain-containing protein [SAR324 cluster bacterium]